MRYRLGGWCEFLSIPPLFIVSAFVEFAVGVLCVCLRNNWAVKGLYRKSIDFGSVAANSFAGMAIRTNAAEFEICCSKKLYSLYIKQQAAL